MIGDCEFNPSVASLTLPILDHVVVDKVMNSSIDLLNWGRGGGISATNRSIFKPFQKMSACRPRAF